MKLLVIHSRDLEKGSTKFRIVQYRDFLKEHDIHLDYIRYRNINSETLEQLPGYDLVVNQKCLVNIGLSREIRKRSRRILFDFDDAIWTRPGKPYGLITGWRVRRRLQYWLNSADVVTTANGFLADYARQYSQCVRVVPMAIDMSELYASETKRETIRIGWAGAPVNLPNLQRLEPVLKWVLGQYPNSELAVFSGRKPRFDVSFIYVPFTPGGEGKFIRSLDIGLLPLVREEHAMGKSPIKSIQYLACGVPIVGDIIGATREILNENNSVSVSTGDEWKKALSTLIENPDLRRTLGAQGYADVHRKHDVSVVRNQLLDTIRSLT